MLVIGMEHNYSAFGGMVVGRNNTTSGESASVSGGYNNIASATFASVSGGSYNEAEQLSRVGRGLIDYIN